MIEPFGSDWLRQATASTGKREPTGLSGTAAIKIGKSAAGTLSIEDGRVIGPCEGTPDVTFPFSASQADQYLAGEFDPSVGYMKGDLKPEGSTGALVATLEVLSWLHSKG